MKPRFNIIYKLRGLLMLPPALFMVFVFTYETENPWLILPPGLGLFTLGLGIRIWAQMHLHYRLKVRKALTTTGPYTFVRNPIYIANTAMLLGLAILSELVWFVPVMLLWCMVVYSFVVRREESNLTEKYGQPYLNFLARVPRWIPRFVLSHDKPQDKPAVNRFFWPSVVAELHCFLWLLPLIAKDIYADFS